MIASRLREKMKALELSEGELGRRSGVPQPTIHRILNGVSLSPRKDSVERIAKVLRVSPEWLLFGVESNIKGGPAIRGLVPLLSWVAAGTFCESGSYSKDDAIDMLPCPFPHSPGAFCLVVSGESMMPDYRDGEIILVDPEQSAKHGDDVVVRTEEGATTFKRLQVTHDGTYLLALNPAYPDRIVKVPRDTHICGVVTASWMSRSGR